MRERERKREHKKTVGRPYIDKKAHARIIDLLPCRGSQFGWLVLDCNNIHVSTESIKWPQYIAYLNVYCNVYRLTKFFFTKYSWFCNWTLIQGKERAWRKWTPRHSTSGRWRGGYWGHGWRPIQTGRCTGTREKGNGTQPTNQNKRLKEEKKNQPWNHKNLKSAVVFNLF